MFPPSSKRSGPGRPLLIIYDFVTVTVYVVLPESPVTFTVTVFVPAAQVTESPLSNSVDPSLHTTVAPALSGVAVTLFDVFVVATV